MIVVFGHSKISLKHLKYDSVCGRMEKQEMENGNGHGKWKRTWKMENLIAHAQNVYDARRDVMPCTWTS